MIDADVKTVIDAKLNARRQAQSEYATRACIIYDGVCPDCASDLIETTGFIQKLFVSNNRTFVCSGCGRFQQYQYPEMA